VADKGPIATYYRCAVAGKCVQGSSCDEVCWLQSGCVGHEAACTDALNLCSASRDCAVPDAGAPPPVAGDPPPVAGDPAPGGGGGA
jgi:hypothetical protein